MSGAGGGRVEMGRVEHHDKSDDKHDDPLSSARTDKEAREAKEKEEKEKAEEARNAEIAKNGSGDILIINNNSLNNFGNIDSQPTADKNDIANKESQNLIVVYEETNTKLLHISEDLQKSFAGLEDKFKSDNLDTKRDAVKQYSSLINKLEAEKKELIKILTDAAKIGIPTREDAKAILANEATAFRKCKEVEQLIKEKRAFLEKINSELNRNPVLNIKKDNYESTKAIEILNFNLDRIAKPLEAMQKQMVEDKKKETEGASRAKCVQYVQILGGISVGVGIFTGIVAYLSYKKPSSTTDSDKSPPKPSKEDLKPFFEQSDSSFWTKFAELVDTQKLSLTDQSIYLNFTIDLAKEDSLTAIILESDERNKIIDNLVAYYKQADKSLSDIYLEISNIKHQDKSLPRITSAALLQIAISQILLENLVLKYKDVAVSNNNSLTARSLAISMSHLMAAAPLKPMPTPTVTTTQPAPTAQSMVNAALDVASSVVWATAWFGPYGSAIIGFGKYLLGEFWPEESNKQKNDVLLDMSITLNSLKEYVANLECDKYSNIVLKYTNDLINKRKILIDLRLNSSNKEELERSNKYVLDFLLGTPIDKNKRESDGFLEQINGALDANNANNLIGVINDLENSHDFEYDVKTNPVKYNNSQEYSRAQLKLNLLVSALSLCVQYYILKIKIETFVNNFNKQNFSAPLTYIKLNTYWQARPSKLMDILHKVALRRANSIILRKGTLQGPFLFSKATFPVEEYGKETITVRPISQFGHQLCRFPMKEESNLLGLSASDESQKAHCFRLVATAHMIYQHGVHESDYEKPSISEFNGIREVLSVTDLVTNHVAEEDLIICDYDTKGNKNKYRDEAAIGREKAARDHVFKTTIDEHQKYIDVKNKLQHLINFWKDQQRPEQPKNIILTKLLWPTSSSSSDDNLWEDYQNYEVCYGISHCNLIGGESEISYTNWEPVNKRDAPTLKNIPIESNETVNCIKIYRKFRKNGSSSTESSEICVGLLERDRDKKFPSTWQDTMPAIKLEENITPSRILSP